MFTLSLYVCILKSMIKNCIIGVNSTRGDSKGIVRSGKDVIEGLGGHFMGL